jgi:hypothetical protein
MIILGCTKFHSKGCTQWIIIMGLRVLLITHYPIQKNISEDSITCPCERCKNKKFLDLNVVTTHLLQKKIIEKYLCLFTPSEPYIPYETIIKRMVESTSSSSNVHWVIDDNSNPYRSMVIDVMRMNQGYTSEYSIIDDKQNADTTWLFDLLKDSDELL